MADNQKLEISGLDFDTIKDNLKTYMKNQDQFLDYDRDWETSTCTNSAGWLITVK